jgi:short-subunit dehydrogenase
LLRFAASNLDEAFDGEAEMRQRILITGASSGLGAALARHYAGPDCLLILWARDSARLEGVAADCRRDGAAVEIRLLDLVDSAAAVTAINKEDTVGAIDIAVLAAGLGDIQSTAERAEDPARVVSLGLVNFVTPSAMAAALAGRMAARGRGRIILIGSAAAFHALPFAAAYAGSKAGLARFAQALRVGVAPHGVQVMLASPGPIATPAGRAVPAPAWLTMQPADVAARIARASAQGSAHLILPWPFALLRVVDRLLPDRLRNALLAGLRPASPPAQPAGWHDGVGPG